MMYWLLPHITKDLGLSKFKCIARKIGNWKNWELKFSQHNSKIYAGNHHHSSSIGWLIQITLLGKPRLCHLRAVRKSSLCPKDPITSADCTGNFIPAMSLRSHAFQMLVKSTSSPDKVNIILWYESWTPLPSTDLTPHSPWHWVEQPWVQNEGSWVGYQLWACFHHRVLVGVLWSFFMASTINHAPTANFSPAGHFP